MMRLLGDPRTFDVDNDELIALCAAMDVQTMPDVIAMTERHDTVAERDQALAAARRRLVERDYIADDGDIDADLVQMLRVLGSPDWTAECRRVDAYQTLRVCLAGDGARRVRVSRLGDQISIDASDSDDDAALFVSVFGALIGETDGADVAEMRFPTDDMEVALRGCETDIEYAEALFGLGVGEMAARRMGSALTSCCGQTEIVMRLNYLSRDAVVTVLDTSYGRIVAETNRSVEDWWTSIAPGPGYRVTAALRRLAENLPDGALL